MNTNKLTIGMNRFGLKVKKKSPEILLGVGILSGIGALALMYRQTLAADEILQHHKQKVKDMEEAREVAEKSPEEYEYDEEMYEADRRTLMVKTGVNLAKAYAPVVALEVLSVTCILVSRNILNKRYLGAVAAYNGLSEVFKRYRNRVIDENGADMDRHYMYGTKIDKEKITVVDENGKKSKELQVTETTEIDQNDRDLSFRVFDCTNPYWDKNPTYSMFFLKSQQNMWNDKLHTRGHVFLNEVLEALGFDQIPMGSLIGWLDDENRTGVIDFGLYDLNKDNVKRFINGKDNAILLEFNHDGIIWDKI